MSSSARENLRLSMSGVRFASRWEPSPLTSTSFEQENESAMQSMPKAGIGTQPPPKHFMKAHKHFRTWNAYTSTGAYISGRRKEARE